MAETRPRLDLDLKLVLYARRAIPEAGLADLRAGRIKRHRGHGEGGYGASDALDINDSIPVPGLLSRPLDLSGLL